VKRFVVRFWVGSALWLVLGLCATRARSQHIHLAAGAESAEVGSKLFFSNGFLYDTNSYGGVYPACVFMSDEDPLYPGLYQSDVSFIALPATLWTGGPTPYAAELDAFIVMKMVSVQGPPGSEMVFWEENEEASQTRKVFTISSGTLDSTNRFNLSEGVTVPEPDPFGHIHGRRYTVNKPGLYTVGVQLIDTSKAGPGGGPVHSPSDTNYFYFQAGLHLTSLARTNDTMNVRFGTRGFKNYHLESSPIVTGTNWTKVAEVPWANHSDLHILTVTNRAEAAFYRVRELPQ
jgi:hypothetical protein